MKFRYFSISKGGITGTVVDTCLLFAVALKCPYCGIILIYNHPSGTLIPGVADKTITYEIKRAAAIFNIKLLDHLIITKKGFYSFADNNVL